MNKTDEEKEILEQAPDFENQMAILKQEQELILKKRKWYRLIISIFSFIFLIFFISYSKIYTYKEYKHGFSQNCENVDLKIDGSPIPNLNITDGKSCKPIYNVDYYNNRLPLFNIDVLGDKSLIFNKINQMDETNTYCVLNCDTNNDGWPDINIDLNGDGIADINIDLDKNGICDLNCDLNYDMIPDTNIDTNFDNIADVNITGDDYTKPIYNIDYKGNRIPTFNILVDGQIINPVVDVSSGAICERNCDIDGDGHPEYNLLVNGILLNELISEKNYINIDVDGDGIPDVNISSDGGQTIQNGLNKPTIIDGKNVVLNYDADNDGFPDFNIDLDNDGYPDLNITNFSDNKCIKNCDTNGDGKSDNLSQIGNNIITIYNLNIDIDYDGICDLNCDINYDLYPDLNIDTNGDGLPNLNIDTNHDKIADLNIDTDGDNIADINIDVIGDGICNFNCLDEYGNITNIINTSIYCLKNCDTDNDGLPDTNIDLNNDGICDLNCNGEINDNNHNYLIDDKEQITNNSIDENSSNTFVITNLLNITGIDIEPGWESNYILVLNNYSNSTVAYNLEWENVINEFTQINNLDYSIARNSSIFMDNLKAPYTDSVLAERLILKANSSVKYVLTMRFLETGIDQNIDSGKTFKASFYITLK